METTTETIEILNDLLAINNDRIRGYENAIEETPATDASLKSLFARMILESKDIRVKLAEMVESLGGEFETGTTGAGKLYRAWMDVKTVFTGHDRHTVLSNCEYGEDAAQSAYRTALSSDELDADTSAILAGQQQVLKISHDQIKALRDESK
jgi:uncharacterized protein (TIGR02284 family)